MDRCFIPYLGGHPLVIEVNGHDLVLVSFDEGAFDESVLLEESSDSPDLEIRSVDLESVAIDDTGLDSTVLHAAEELTDFHEDEIPYDAEQDGDLDAVDLDEGEIPFSELPQIIGGDDGKPMNSFPSGNPLQPTIPHKVITGVTRLVAREAQSGVLFVPPNVPLDSLIGQLTEELPWLQ